MTETKIKSIPTNEKTPTPMLKHSTVLAGNLFGFSRTESWLCICHLDFWCFFISAVHRLSIRPGFVHLYCKTKIAAELWWRVPLETWAIFEQKGHHLSVWGECLCCCNKDTIVVWVVSGRRQDIYSMCVFWNEIALFFISQTINWKCLLAYYQTM